jgi:archaetidylinositol phosphate synthase
MVLDNYRTTLDWWLVPLAKAFRRVDPDVFTWASLAVAVLGGVAFWRSGPSAEGLTLLLVAWACVLLNSVLDLLDGKVAKLTGKATPRGDYLDHAVDRFADTAFILGIAFSPWARLEWGVAAIVAILLTSYMGTQAQAVGLKRNYGGLLGRADRMVLLLVLPLAEYLWAVRGFAAPWQPTFVSMLEVTLAYFAVVGVLTTVQRFVGGLRSFGPDGKLKQG